eukprot:556624-Prymnesium_polylepis.1
MGSSQTRPHDVWRITSQGMSCLNPSRQAAAACHEQQRIMSSSVPCRAEQQRIMSNTSSVGRLYYSRHICERNQLYVGVDRVEK